ncbi:MAG: phytanoyl-CoA dioxygenase family protein [Bacteroidetes bacterium]|nr:phytanoyl-CoA dioxygenase family protein [Bacteroidota bacterium]
MIRELFDTHKSLKNRNFSQQLFLDSDAHNSLVRNGYVVFKNVLSTSEIEYLKNIYYSSKQEKGFEEVDYYINSIGFTDKDIRDKLKSETDSIIQQILKRIYNSNNTFFPLGAGYAINPSNATRGCLPHQDPTFVNEDESFSLTTWISLDNTTIENGCIMVIPGSHLWNNKYRSVLMPWKFNRCVEELWKYMIPIPVSAGDILCFDVALIHASKNNITNKERIAMTIQALPKGVELFSYFPKNKFIVEEYIIDGNYFIKESQYNKPTKKYKRNRIFFDISKYKKSDISKLVNEYYLMNNTKND